MTTDNLQSCRQHGHTIIELMIALTVALFLLAGMATLEQSMRQTFGNQSGLAQLQDEERFALSIIGQVVQEAGYYPDPTNNSAALVFPAAGAFASGQSLSGTHANGAAAPGDTLAVRVFTSGTAVANPNFDPSTNISCVGASNSTAAATLYTNAFSIKAATATTPAALQCMDGVGVFAPVDLVQGVTNLQVWYGVKTLGGTTNNPDVYKDAGQMTAADWPNVATVRVFLTFNNPLSGQPGQPATVTISRIIAVMQHTGIQI